MTSCLVPCKLCRVCGNRNSNSTSKDNLREQEICLIFCNSILRRYYLQQIPEFIEASSVQGRRKRCNTSSRFQTFATMKRERDLTVSREQEQMLEMSWERGRQMGALRVLSLLAGPLDEYANTS